MCSIKNPSNILLVNYRYFISGGSERYLFNFSEVLEKNGHTVIPFSVKHPKNVTSSYSKYFLSSLTNDENCIFFSQIRKNPKTLSRLFDRNLYSIEAKTKMKQIMEKYDINVAYLLHFFRWISPSIIQELSKNKIPIIVRISDFQYICPGTYLLRRGKICELCIKGNLWHSVKNRCVQNSYFYSFVHYISTILYKKMNIMDKIDAFICPSLFTLEKMVQGGFPREKLFHIPTFINSKIISPDFKTGEYILYFGTVSPEKGISVLIDAFKKLRRENSRIRTPLFIVGKLYRYESTKFRETIYLNKTNGIKYFDEQKKGNLNKLIKNSAFVVVPSIWYDNFPNVILESFSLGKAVVGSRIGSIPELVKHGETGMLFEPGDSDDLAKKMMWMLSHSNQCEKMGEKARKLVEAQYNAELHYKRVMQVFRLFQS